MAEGTERRQAAAIAPPADVYGFYSRLGIVLARSRREWAPVRCFLPGHADRRASSAVNLTNGVWRCFACDTNGSPFAAAIARGYSRRDAAALAKQYGLWLGGDERGLRVTSTVVTAQPESARIDWQALSERVRAPRPKVLRRHEYVYVDEAGEPLLRAVREDFADGSKQFWQERHESGEWIPGLNETRRVLYRLPEVLERAREGGLVLVVEGEKCCEALDRLGILATTSPAGAGKWRDEYACALSGALVAVCPDCDLPGRRHAVQVARSCLEQGMAVFGPLELYSDRQDGFDLADYLAEVAETARTVSAKLSREAVRARLRDHTLRLVRSCLPATSESLFRYLERAEFNAEPRGRVWRRCERCERERAHQSTAGVLYCPCGALSVP